MTLSASAGTVRIPVPSGTVLVNTTVIGKNTSTGSTDYTTYLTSSPVNGSVSITMPNDSASMTYQGLAQFQDSQNNVIGQTSFSNSDASGGSSGGGPSHGPVQTRPQPDAAGPRLVDT